jgi:hypothetical protein
MTLKDALPVLFGIACAKDAPVEAHMDFSGDAIKWNVSFAKTAQNWEVDVFASFYKLLYLARMWKKREWNEKIKTKRNNEKETQEILRGSVYDLRP